MPTPRGSGPHTPHQSHPPVIPDPPSSAPVGWAQHPTHAGTYPAFNPYFTPGHGFAPNLPAAGPSPYSSFYTPAGPPISTPYHHYNHTILPNGLSSDYNGYPRFTGGPPPPIEIHPGTPHGHGPGSAPVIPGGWPGAPGPQHFQHQYTPFQHPHSAGLGPFSGFTPQGWPQERPQEMLNFNGWGGHSPAAAPPGWAYQGAPMPQRHVRQDPQLGDRVPQFMAGPNCM